MLFTLLPPKTIGSIACVFSVLIVELSPISNGLEFTIFKLLFGCGVVGSTTFPLKIGLTVPVITELAFVDIMLFVGLLAKLP